MPKLEGLYEAPPTRPYFALITPHADLDVQRNLLLHFIHEKGLDNEFLKWLKRNAPEYGE